MNPADVAQSALPLAPSDVSILGLFLLRGVLFPGLRNSLSRISPMWVAVLIAASGERRQEKPSM